MEEAQAVCCFDTRATKGIDGFKDALRQLVSSGGAGDNVLPNPIKLRDIVIAYRCEWAGVICQSIELFGPRVYSVYDGVIYLAKKRID